MSSRDITNIWQCNVVNENYKKLVNIAKRIEEFHPIDICSSDSEKKAHFENMSQSMLEEYSSIIESGAFYDKQFKFLSEKYKFPNENLEACKSSLEVGAFCYFSANSSIYLKAFLRGLEKQIKPLVNQASKLQYYIDKLLEVGGEIDTFFDGPSVYQLVQDTSENLQQLSQIKEQLRNSSMAQTANLGVRAPAGNPGLPPFIMAMDGLWANQMNRTLTQSYDGINGRKQFLEFLMDCLKPLDPTLSFDTVDNALKKKLADWKNG